MNIQQSVDVSEISIHWRKLYPFVNVLAVVDCLVHGETPVGQNFTVTPFGQKTLILNADVCNQSVCCNSPWPPDSMAYSSTCSIWPTGRNTSKLPNLPRVMSWDTVSLSSFLNNVFSHNVDNSFVVFFVKL